MDKVKKKYKLTIEKLCSLQLGKDMQAHPLIGTLPAEQQEAARRWFNIGATMVVQLVNQVSRACLKDDFTEPHRPKLPPKKPEPSKSELIKEGEQPNKLTNQVDGEEIRKRGTELYLKG